MAQLNSNIPYLEAYVKNRFLFGIETDDLTKCYVFGVKSVLNQPLLFHCQLENGAVFWSVPLNYIVHKKDYVETSLNNLQWWNMQSSDIACTVFAYLQGYRVDCKGRDGEWRSGEYQFTIDDYCSDLNMLPLGYAMDTDKKCFHVIKLDCGNFCAYPNNYLRWHNLNFCEPYDKENPPKYKANKIKHNCEE